MILLDTSALAKLLVEEAESPALRGELADRQAGAEDFAISTIATIELRRLALRLALAPDRIVPVVQPFRILRLTEGILHLAGHLPTPHLGTLDAIHVATALSVEAHSLLTYDVRQAGAAEAEGLHVIRPQ